MNKSDKKIDLYYIIKLEKEKSSAHIQYFDNKITYDKFQQIIDYTDIELNNLNKKYTLVLTFLNNIKKLNLARYIDLIKSSLAKFIYPSSSLFNIFIDKIEISKSGEAKFFYKF